MTKSKIPMVANKLIVGKESSETAAIPLSLPLAASAPITKQPKSFLWD
jgi:hypothetical protein